MDGVVWTLHVMLSIMLNNYRPLFLSLMIASLVIGRLIIVGS
jgi:hypothetical protein